MDVSNRALKKLVDRTKIFNSLYLHEELIWVHVRSSIICKHDQGNLDEWSQVVESCRHPLKDDHEEIHYSHQVVE